MIKIFRGGRGGDTLKTPSPYEQLLPLLTPCFKMFLERSLNDPHPPPPHFKHLSLLPPPHPPPLPPLKILIVHLKGRTPFRIHFWGECCQNYKLRFVAKFFRSLCRFELCSMFSESVLMVWFLKKKNKLGKTAVLDTLIL